MCKKNFSTITELQLLELSCILKLAGFYILKKFVFNDFYISSSCVNNDLRFESYIDLFAIDGKMDGFS